jgi:cytoskeletal protein CcmA (bactofilin family)
MAITPGFFNKREPEAPTPRHIPSTHNNTSYSPTGTPVAQPVTAVAAPVSDAVTAPEGGSKLTVGPNIKLKGVEITDCDTLVVEGLVEATMDSRVIQISERGAFKGAAEIDIAEIHGQFDGNLTVRQKLTIFSTGKVSGKIRYGKVVIEEGGQLTGEIFFGAATQAPKSGTQEKPVLSVANSA